MGGDMCEKDVRRHHDMRSTHLVRLATQVRIQRGAIQTHCRVKPNLVPVPSYVEALREDIRTLPTIGQATLLLCHDHLDRIRWRSGTKKTGHTPSLQVHGPTYSARGTLEESGFDARWLPLAECYQWL